MIDVDGETVGQVNALAVYQIGDIAFGRPSRITAETFMGKAGVINIEREAKLSGKTHDKGVLILSGYLGRTFAQHFPLSLSISITFEQSYGGIDGDSASSTELYAILVEPVRYSHPPGHCGDRIGQPERPDPGHRRGQPEDRGLFRRLPQAKGLTGNQGVMIPGANVKNLMLKEEVVEAVKGPISHLAGGHHRGGHRNSHRPKCRRTRSGRELPPRQRVRTRTAQVENLSGAKS